MALKLLSLRLTDLHIHPKSLMTIHLCMAATLDKELCAAVTAQAYAQWCP